MKNNSGMPLLRKHLKESGKTITWLANQLKITRGAISQWKEIPLSRIVDVERITGVSRTRLRPDLYEGVKAN